MGRLHPNQRLIKSYLDAFSGGDIDAIAAHVTNDFQNKHLSLLGKGCESKETYKGRLKGFLASFEKLYYELESSIADDKQGAAKYTMHFQHDGKAIAVGGIFWFTFHEGLIASRTDCWDGLKYLRQIDASPEDIAALLE